MMIQHRFSANALHKMQRQPDPPMFTFSRFTRYFIEVARQGSIRKASDVLHVSASAIDRQILRAEEELGAQLFERLPGRLRLTAAGELLLVDVKQWEKGFMRTLRALARSGGGVALMSWLDAAADVEEGRLAFVPLKSALVKPMTLALCTAPQRQLSRAAQLAIQALIPRVEGGLRGG